MLFHSSKKPVELQVIHLNKVKQKRQKQLESAYNQDKSKFCLPKLCQLVKDKQDIDADLKDGAKSVYLLDFDGDIKASAVDCLREEISAVIASANSGDEVVVRLESGGGQVSGYGLAAAQLDRIKQAGLTLTVCVDKVAASGGYMMACVANKIIASDFAIIGSIGVISQLPNFYQWLKEHNIDVESFQAGEYKRTVTMFDKNDDKDRAKYQAEIDRIHELFKNHIKKHRPILDLDKVATGEFWFGVDALALGLIDEIGTSDSYLFDLIENHNVFALHSRTKPSLAEKLGLTEQVRTSIDALIHDTSASMINLISKLNRP